VSLLVEALEARFAARLGLPGAVAFGFGRAALRAALAAAGVAGQAVAVPDFVCAQVPEAVRLAGARPVSYPVGRDLSVAPEEFASALDRGCRAAVVTHYFGRVLPNVSELAALAEARGVTLVEDAALALDASFAERPAGSFGELAAFSFTKSGWCFGGGMVVTRSEALRDTIRRIRQDFSEDRFGALRYGMLRRLDYASNRPGWAREAGAAGRIFQGLLGPRCDNFYDAGRFDTRLPALAARRAHRLLDALERDRERRGALLAALENRLPAALLFRRASDPGDNAAFLLLRAPRGDAARLVERAAARRVTLRLAWPAYQPLTAACAGEAVAWLAGHLAILEIHPQWRAAELTAIVAAFAAEPPDSAHGP
jgi:dTDP-4-amino-4,6-dideoxygalactose transaminase